MNSSTDDSDDLIRALMAQIAELEDLLQKEAHQHALKWSQYQQGLMWREEKIHNWRKRARKAEKELARIDALRPDLSLEEGFSELIVSHTDMFAEALAGYVKDYLDKLELEKVAEWHHWEAENKVHDVLSEIEQSKDLRDE